jgi:hypothetical protein
MRIEHQLSLFLDNKPGVLARACHDLVRRGINIEAITVANLVDHAVVRMVVSDPRAAEHLLGESGTLVIASEVLAIDLTDRPGAIEQLARKLGKAKVNIDYMYGSSRGGDGRATVFVRVSDMAKARRALARWPTAPQRPQGRTRPSRRPALRAPSTRRAR